MKGESGVKSILNWTTGIAAIAFVLLLMVIIFGNLSGNVGFDDSIILNTVANETGYINGSNYTLSGFNSSWSSITITSARNATNNSLITTTLYSVDSSGVVRNTTTAFWNSAWIAYTYNHAFISSEETAFEDIITNYTEGAVNTSAQFPTVGTILGVALLILILLALLVFVIMKMSGISGGKSSGGSMDRGDFA